MMFDVTVFWRWFGHLLPLPAMTGYVLIHADHLIMLGFLCVCHHPGGEGAGKGSSR
jgi:hypothetical protein